MLFYLALSPFEQQECIKCVKNLKVGDYLWVYCNIMKDALARGKTRYTTRMEVLAILDGSARRLPFNRDILLGCNDLEFNTYPADYRVALSPFNEKINLIKERTKYRGFRILDDGILIARIEKQFNDKLHDSL